MHGVRRGSAGEPVATDERAQVLGSLASEALEIHRRRDFSEIAREKVGRALENNPDEYSLWNYRKEMMIAGASSECGSDEERLEGWKQEIKLTDRALRRHHKAYGAWQHRLWLFSSSGMVDGETQKQYLLKERETCSGILQVDDRNFHAWAYRLLVQQLIRSGTMESEGVQAAEDLSFTMGKIESNFANYSAWHLRSHAFPKSLAGGTREEGNTESCVSAERETTWQALFTEPAVQSVWFYRKWLLDGAPLWSGSGGGACHATYDVTDAMLRAELESLNELLSIEPDAKLGLYHKVRRSGRERVWIQGLRGVIFCCCG